MSADQVRLAGGWFLALRWFAVFLVLAGSAGLMSAGGRLAPVQVWGRAALALVGAHRSFW
jgi:hypothetical protein